MAARGSAHRPTHWLLQKPCPICRRAMQPAEEDQPLCIACRVLLRLPMAGLQGQDPLPWWGAGTYAEDLRRLLLRQRRRPRPEAIEALLHGVVAGLPRVMGDPLLVPIPSWKRQANPLPPLLCERLGQRWGLHHRHLLERSRPVLGQHHLNRAMRFANQEEAFRCRRLPLPGQARRKPVLIVDDILTSGATACSAARTLESSGWRVLGLLCLARTPSGEPQAVI